MNCDGAVTDGGDKAACGGVLRNHLEAFLCGFGVSLGGGSVVEVEL